MGLITFLPRLTLIVINLIFFLVSVALIVLGLLLRFGGSTVTGWLDSALSKVNTSVKSLFSGGTGLNTSNLNLGEVFNTVAIIAIVLGVIFLAFCFFGLFGACCKNRSMLKIYVFIIGALVVGEIVVLIIIASNPDTIKTPLKTSLKTTIDKYQGINGTDAYSLVWSVLMVQFQCCGLTGYEDFKGSTSWWGVNRHVTPLTCCKTTPTSTADMDACAGASSSTSVTSLTNSNYNKGCLNEIWNIVVHSSVAIVVVAIGLACQVVLIIFGVILIKKSDKGKVKPESADYTPRNHHRRRDSGW